MIALEAEPYLDGKEWAEVRRLPQRFDPYAAEELVQRPAGASGKTAFLQLHFELRDGKTRLVRNYSGGHQIVRQVHYMDTALGDLAVVFIQAVSAGILQGDRIRTEIKLGPGARALITTQAATKVFEMKANYATQRMDISVGPGAHAEVLMDPLIAYSGARFYNEINVDVDPAGSLVYSDHLTPGRVAYGESWQFDVVYSRLRVRRPNGELIVADTNVLTPKADSVQTPGLFGEASDMGVLHVISEQCDDAGALADAMHDSVQSISGIVGGASVLPSGVGAHARVLGMSTSRTECALHAAWRAARRHLLDVDVTPIYRTKHGFEPTIVYEVTNDD